MAHPERGLANLIRDHQAMTGDSYTDLARASGLSKAKIGQLATMGLPHMPRADTLRKLAVGLKLPFPVVQHAAMVEAGLSPEQIPSDQRSALLAARIAELPEHDIETIELIVRALHVRADNRKPDARR